MEIPLSVLDLAPVSSGTSAAECVRRIVDLARLAEQLGFRRYWFAEHHSLPAVASSSPEVLIAHVAARTERIRVGSGGIMLPNHTPMRVAEAFKTLAALYPDRIDLGIGRAPGSEEFASKALRAFDASAFSPLVSELLSFTRKLFPNGHPFASLQAMPEDAVPPPIWILGSTGASAESAGRAGLGYAFATHFTAESPGPAISMYREAFTPNAEFAQPSAILAVAVVCADTSAEAERLATTMDLGWLRIERGEFSALESPEEVAAHPFNDSERASIKRRRNLVVVGDPEEVREQLTKRMAESGADELMIVTNVWSHEARLRSYELVAQALA
jgi:luciferase family oxidoreductase group 1